MGSHVFRILQLRKCFGCRNLKKNCEIHFRVPDLLDFIRYRSINRKWQVNYICPKVTEMGMVFHWPNNRL